MDVSKTDELLADFLIRYKVGGVHGDQDPKLATFECRWASIKRQFSLRGLTVKKNNFPNTYTSLKDRRQTLSQMEKNIKARKETGKSFVIPNVQKGTLSGDDQGPPDIPEPLTRLKILLGLTQFI